MPASLCIQRRLQSDAEIDHRHISCLFQTSRRWLKLTGGYPRNPPGRVVEFQHPELPLRRIKYGGRRTLPHAWSSWAVASGWLLPAAVKKLDVPRDDVVHRADDRDPPVPGEVVERPALLEHQLDCTRHVATGHGVDERFLLGAPAVARRPGTSSGSIDFWISWTMWSEMLTARGLGGGSRSSRRGRRPRSRRRTACAP